MCLHYKSCENTMGKGEIARDKQFLLFPQCFLTFWRTFHHLYQIQNFHQQTFSVWKSLEFVVWERVNKGKLLIRELIASANCNDPDQPVQPDLG